MLELSMCAHSTGAGAVGRATLLLRHAALNSGFATSRCQVLQQSKTMDKLVVVALGLITDVPTAR